MDKLFLRLVNALAVLSGVILALVAVLIPVNLVLRACCSTSIYGLLDAVEYGLMAVTFLAAPWVLVNNGHVTVDIATLLLPDTLRRPLARLVNLAGILLSLLLAWYAFSAATISFERGSMIRTAFNVPEWLTLAPPVVAGILLAWEFLRRFWRVPVWRDPEHDRSTAGL